MFKREHEYTVHAKKKNKKKEINLSTTQSTWVPVKVSRVEAVRIETKSHINHF